MTRCSSSLTGTAKCSNEEKRKTRSDPFFLITALLGQKLENSMKAQIGFSLFQFSFSFNFLNQNSEKFLLVALVLAAAAASSAITGVQMSSAKCHPVDPRNSHQPLGLNNLWTEQQLELERARARRSAACALNVHDKVNIKNSS